MADMSRRAFTAGLGTALLLTLAACGRREGLDTPYQAAVDARREAMENKDEVVPPEPAPPKTERKFVLDPLI